MGSFSLVALPVAISVYFAFLPSGALFSFEVIGFIRETLAEEAELISIKYIFKLII